MGLPIIGTIPAKDSKRFGGGRISALQRQLLAPLPSVNKRS